MSITPNNDPINLATKIIAKKAVEKVRKAIKKKIVESVICIDPYPGSAINTHKDSGKN